MSDFFTNPDPKLSADDFEFVRGLLDQQIGMALEPDQEVFVAGRLFPVAERNGWDRLEPLIVRLRESSSRGLAQEVIESVVTHETSFFRDPHYFEALIERVVPDLIRRRLSERRLTIWCAACSTGQEAYSIAMLLREHFAEQLEGWTIDLYGTDVSSRALEQAAAGRFTDVEVRRGLSGERLARFFRREPRGWRIDQSLRQMVQFRQVNLTGTWPNLRSLDLVLLRNVLIYMSPSTRQNIISRMKRVIDPTGCLMLGSTETASAVDCQVVFAGNLFTTGFRAE
jgi:chemotaxis protein methyltransferase CheR